MHIVVIALHIVWKEPEERCKKVSFVAATMSDNDLTSKERLHSSIISLQLVWKILNRAKVIGYSKDLISLVFKGQTLIQYNKFRLYKRKDYFLRSNSANLSHYSIELSIELGFCGIKPARKPRSWYKKYTEVSAWGYPLYRVSRSGYEFRQHSIAN